MKGSKMRTTWMIGTLALALAACGGKSKASEGPKMDGDKMDGDKMGGDKMGMGMDMKMGMADPAPATRAVLDSVKDYASWPKFTENETPNQSEGHMNMYVLAFHNQVVTDAIAAATLPLPDGAIIVKQEMMKADDPPMSITVMSKQAGAWYWVKASPDGMKVMTMDGMAMEGNEVGMCKDCHDNAADNDFVLTHKFK